MKKFSIKFLFGFILFTQLLFSLAVQADPTPEQIAIFKNLSPEKQQKAIQAYKNKKADSSTQPNIQTTIPPTVIPRNPEGDKKIESNASKATETTPDTVEKKENKNFEKIKQFGYDLFAGTPTTFAPATDIPVPLTYVIGPGDNILIQLYGKENNNYNLIVNREGILQFPGIGPVSVAGLSFSELQELLKNRINKQLIGVEASITLGTLRSIRIFVLGEVERPGSYTVSALSTMTNALFASGGVANIGSLRNIQLKRNGKIITRMDLYDLLLRGDTSKDARLMPGDVIFVPPIGKTVGITGEIRRPAIYEIKNEKRVSEILKLAGDLLPTSYTKLATIERINKKDNRTYVDINIRSKSGLNKRIYDGDIIKIFSVLDKVEDVVLIKGHVKRNLGLEWKHGMKISDILKNRDNLLPGYDSRYALIEREDQITKKLHVINFNIDKALLNDYKNDISLEKGDVIHIFALGQDRTKSLNSIIRKLNEQATHKQPAQTVSVKGNIRSPGDFPLYKGMTLQNLIFAAADLLPETDINYALIERKNPETQDSYIIQIDLSEESQNNFILKPLDKVIIFDLHSNRQSILAPIISKLESQATLNNKQRAISISGRVKFSGKYPYTEKMTLATLIDASGGYLDDVYLADAEIRRYKTINGERREISKLTVNLKNDLSRIKLKPYDEIIIRRIPDWTETESVKVVGEVKFPGTYTVSKSDTLWDVIKRAGGITEYADPNAAVFTRKTLKEKEQLELDRYRKQLDQLLASEQLESAKSLDKTLTPDTSVMDTDLANRIASTEAIGRLIIDMPKILNSNGAEGNVTLMEGDVLAIPRKRQDVSILGQVNFPTSHLYKEGYLLDDYISESGGFTAKADEDRIYVIKANGSVLATDRSSWFSQQSHEIAPGDTIVVPYDVDHVSPIIQWGNISRILFQLATTAATLKTVGVF